MSARKRRAPKKKSARAPKKPATRRKKAAASRARAASRPKKATRKPQSRLPSIGQAFAKIPAKGRALIAASVKKGERKKKAAAKRRSKAIAALFEKFNPFALPLPTPATPRRKRQRPPALRDPSGRFAPKDEVGDTTEKGWIQVYLPGWMREAGDLGVAYSSLREHPRRVEYIEMLREAGGTPEEWKEIAAIIADETNVHVQEVYTLGLSP